jgi:sugar lactone lactonase YvrE
MRRVIALFVSFAIAGGVAIACGGDSGGDDAAKATPGPRRAEPTPARSGTPAPVEAADLKALDLQGVAAAPDGSVYLADTVGSRVLRVDADGNVTNHAGKPGLYAFEGDGGKAAAASLHGPTGLAVDSAGNMYIVDHGNNRVRRVDQEGTITTVVGSGAVGTEAGSFSGDGGPATKATLREPIGIAVDRSGGLYVADRDNYRVRAVDSSGTITTIAGNGSTGPMRRQGPATESAIKLPVGVATGPNGAVYISDEEAHRILKVDANGAMTTFAGTGKPGYSGDGGPAAEAELNGPYLLATDGRGNLYIADALNHVIRVVDRKGSIRTVAGTGTAGFRGDGGPATKARLNEPWGVAVDASGAIYIGDHGNGRVRRVNRSGTITTIVP